MKDALSGFDAVLDHLTGEIFAGTVGPGERLPNERELAVQLGASRSAVREAIKVLQAQGVVTSQTGPRGGTRVATGQGVALGRMLKLHIALGAISFDEVTHTRVELERAAAGAAASAGGSDGQQCLEFLAALVAEMRDTTDAAAYNDLDTRFHVGIAGLAANRLIRDITIAIREAVAVQILLGEQALADWEQLRATLNADHAAILEALQARDGVRAAQLCEDHIRRAHRVLIGEP